MPKRSALSLPIDAESRADFEARVIALRPNLANDLKALEDALQALSILGLHDRITAEERAKAEAEYWEAKNLERREAEESQAKIHAVTDPFAPPAEIPDLSVV